jgi:uncharacterized protein (UPF0332 family)
MMDIDELVRLGFIVRIAPAKDLAQKEFAESEYDLNAAKSELTAGNWKWAIVQAYYSMFHSAKAVMFLMGLKEKTHYSVGEFLEVLSKEGKLESNFANDFRAAMCAREGADYHYKHPQHTAEEIVDLAEDFVERMKMLAKNV